ncbi:MAG: Fic family protein [Bacteroidetes bacterium]|nr:MAG: Fic family protein [Bacteroidota bacterium]
MKNKIEKLIWLSQLPIIEKIDTMKAKIDAIKPISLEKEAKIMQKMRLDWNFHSNAIEGNSLDYGETVTFLMHGLTAKGKPLKDHLDIKGHNNAIHFLSEIVKSEQDFTEADIRTLHKMILIEPYQTSAQTPDGKTTKKTISLGEYKKMPNHVQTLTGETHFYASPEETPIKMQELMDFYRNLQANSQIHALVLCAVFHYEFVNIHPFDDGNGRMARLLMNLILMKKGFPVIVIRQEKEFRNQYYAALAQADSETFQPFVELLAEGLLHSLETFWKGANGESMEEPDDLDKELFLFKKELEGRKDRIEMKFGENTVNLVFNHTIQPLLKHLQNKLLKFKDLFFDFKINDFSKDSLTETYFFSEFRAENTFSIYVELFVVFGKYQYEIFYKIDETQTSIISNYFHISLKAEEIEEISKKIAQETFEYIKQKTKE